MEEDDDAFLYGEDSSEPQGKVVDATRKGEAEGQLSTTEAEKGEEVPKEEQEGNDEEEDDEDEDDDDDSDSDLEIIVDGSVGAGPPVGYNARQQAAPIRNAAIQRPAPSVITSEYTPNARPGQSPSVASLAAIAGLDDAANMDQPGASTIGATSQQINSSDLISMNQLPEGGPPPVPITAPRLELDPSEQSLMLPPETVDGEPGPIIYHIDPTEFEEKPWRRPGADMTDWFNYGFNEDSWRLWGEKKHNRTVERREMEANGGRNDMMNDGGREESDQHDQGSSNYMSNMPPQQMQAMQAMMGATGMSMSPEQMMAFMGMGSGMGMPGGGMMGMPGMGGMFGQPSANPGMFNGAFGNVPSMQMMQPSFQQNGNFMQQQQQQHQHQSQQHDGGDGESNAGLDNRQASVTNGNATESAIESEGGIKEQGQGTPQPPMMDNDREESQHPSNLPRGPRSDSMAARGVGVPGAPTGPSKHSSLPKRPVTEQASAASAPATVPSKNIPTGPKNPGRHYNDRDTGMGIADSLDYGANVNNHHQENTPQSPDGKRRQRSNDGHSRDVSTDREREHERERERERSEGGAKTSYRRTKDRKESQYRRQSSPEDELERITKRDGRRSDERKSSSTSTSQRYGSSRRGDYRDDRRRSASPERDEEWDKESVESSSSRRRTSTRQQQGRSSNRSERRRGGVAEDQVDSGSETEKERKHGRSQARSERRAGRAGDESKTSSRKRGAPEEDLSPVRSTTSRKLRR